jgi:hypothetical protein
MSRRVAGYLTGCCADFGLQERGTRRIRRILPWRIQERTFAYLAYDLHFGRYGDQDLLVHRDWALFGLAYDDVLAEFRRLELKNLWLVQTGGGAVRITWRLDAMERLFDEFAAGRL